MAVEPPIYTIKNAQLSFGLNPLFTGVDLNISRGNKICLVGRNGSGKSTLLNALLEVDDSIGSKIGLQPMTFVIDTFTNEMQTNEAIIRKINSEGTISEMKLSRNEALYISKEERDYLNIIGMLNMMDI